MRVTKPDESRAVALVKEQTKADEAAWLSCRERRR